MKQCRQCKNDFPETTDYFYTSKQGKNGLHSICKTCKNDNVKKHNAKKEVKERKAIYRKQYREKNKEKQAIYMKQWREKNKEKLVNDRKKYYEENKEDIKNYLKQYREKNREQLLFKSKQYREANKEKRRVAEILYKQTERGKNIRYYGCLRYRSRKHKTKFNRVERTQILDRDKWTCQMCGIKVHDQSVGDWNTPDKAHIDHVIPLSKGGHSDINNLQILCRTCNITKSDKTFLGGDNVEQNRTPDERTYDGFRCL